VVNGTILDHWLGGSASLPPWCASVTAMQLASPCMVVTGTFPVCLFSAGSVPSCPCHGCNPIHWLSTTWLAIGIGASAFGAGVVWDTLHHLRAFGVRSLVFGNDMV
jgi:hypothetical protein